MGSLPLYDAMHQRYDLLNADSYAPVIIHGIVSARSVKTDTLIISLDQLIPA